MKDEDSTKVKIETNIDFTILDNENLQIVTSHQGVFNDIVAARQVEVMRLRDEGIRQALVKLGWTPPWMAPSILEDNVRSLQGIIDDLRIILGAADGERITDAARRAATKRPAQATQVEVTDDLVEKARVETFQKTGADLIPEVAATFARAILALRPVQVPMTDEEATAMIRETVRGSTIRRDGSTSLQIVRAAEAHHGITAQAKKEGA